MIGYQSTSGLAARPGLDRRWCPNGCHECPEVRHYLVRAGNTRATNPIVGSTSLLAVLQSWSDDRFERSREGDQTCAMAVRRGRGIGTGGYSGVGSISAPTVSVLADALRTSAAVPNVPDERRDLLRSYRAVGPPIDVGRLAYCRRLSLLRLAAIHRCEPLLELVTGGRSAP